MKKIAVVSDAVSDGYFFPMWYKYYKSHFGSENLHVVTYKGRGKDFANYHLGSVIELPNDYDDTLRAKFISALVNSMLCAYDAVVRIDTDEFLVPQGGAKPGLASFLSASDKPYISARGFDLIAGPDEKSLDVSAPILVDQRRFVYGVTTLNKIAYTTVPANWSEGFHSCSLYPSFDDLYLFHLKFVDIDLQLQWRSIMSGAMAEDAANYEHLRNYYLPDYERLSNYRNGILSRPLVHGYDGLRRSEHTDRFLKETSYQAKGGIYKTPNFHDPVLVELPSELQAAF